MRVFAAMSIVLLILISAACFGATKIPQTHYYVLNLTRGETGSQSNDAAARDGIDIGVGDFLVDPPYDQDRIVYRVNSETAEVGLYSYHRWASPLSRMLPGVVANGFRGAPGISSIEPVMPNGAYAAIWTGGSKRSRKSIRQTGKRPPCASS